jgi:hypothetical protein
LLNLSHGEDIVTNRVHRNFDLARALISNPPDVLFHEGVEPYYDVKFEDLATTLPAMVKNPESSNDDYYRAGSILSRFGRLVEETERAFPNGLPERESLLTDEQRVFLYNHGGAMLAFGLGAVKEIRGIDIRVDEGWSENEVGSWTGLIYEDAFKNRKFLSETFEGRETRGLARIIELYSTGKVTGQGAIIFGGAHLFEDYSNDRLQIQRQRISNESDYEKYRLRWPKSSEFGN